MTGGQGAFAGHRALVVEDGCVLADDPVRALRRAGAVVAGPLAPVESALLAAQPFQHGQPLLLVRGVAGDHEVKHGPRARVLGGIVEANGQHPACVLVPAWTDTPTDRSGSLWRGRAVLWCWPMSSRASLDVSMPAGLAAQAAELVASGRRGTASEVIRAGLRLLQEGREASAQPRLPRSKVSGDA